MEYEKGKLLVSNLTYNEFQQVGVNYDDFKKVEKYESEMSFRDFKTESKRIAMRMGLNREHSIIEIGTGPGNFSVEISKMCKKVYAIDISKVMLNYASAKAKKENVSNIEFINSGFLNYEHKDELVDAVVTDITLHHLPDFWKQVALMRVNSMLKLGGTFYLADQIYSFPPLQYEEKFNEWINFNWERSNNEAFKKDVEVSVKEEYSTFEWIMDGMLERAGFSFEKIKETEFFVVYICKKEKEVE